MPNLDIPLLKAARGLAGWSATDLAAASGASVSAIRYFESGKGQLSQINEERILTALHLAGVKITENGVQRREIVTFLDGTDWYLRLLDDVLTTLKGTGGELLLDMADDRESPPEVIEKYRLMRSHGIGMRQTVEEGNTYLMGPVAEYRWIPKDYYQNWLTLTYGDKFALVLEDNESCYVFADANIARRERRKFNLIWKLLPEPSVESTADVRF